LALFGVLTAVSGGKRGLEGEAAFVVFWLVAAPLAIAVLQFAQVRREVSDRALVPAGVSAALIVCFGAGALSGSTVVADLALAAALLAGGAATRISVLTLCGLGVGASTAALGALGASAALVTAATGLVLLACGALAERTGWPAVRPARDRGRSSKEVDRAAAEVCAAAFDEDPAMVALVPRSRSRRQAMLRLWFRGLLRIARRFAGRQPEIVCSAGEVSAVCVVFEPDHYEGDCARQSTRADGWRRARHSTLTNHTSTSRRSQRHPSDRGKGSEAPPCASYAARPTGARSRSCFIQTIGRTSAGTRASVLK
jgi:hypothetical protein